MMTPLQILRTIKLGARNLLLHKTRSALTMLGIIFGVCSVITMLAIGEGTSAEALATIRRLGSTNIILTSEKPPEETQSSGQSQSWAIEYGLTYDDAYRLVETVPGVQAVVPSRHMRAEVQFGGSQQNCTVVGTYPNYIDVAKLEMAQGRFLTDMDVERQTNVCILTRTLAKSLFPYQNPTDEAVQLNGKLYEVVGVMESPGGAAAQELENRVYIPMSTSRSLFGELLVNRSSGSFSAERVQLHEIVVGIEDLEGVEEAAAVIGPLLAKFHRKADYAVSVPLRHLREAERTKRLFNNVLGSIAAISLLVGGIGIMNIMMATVTERTREIGIRRALGARRSDIVLQFLVETVVLSVGGGLVGVGLGVALPMAVTRLWDIPTIITMWSLLLSFGISALVGLVFGIYPASRAAQLDPIEALRHE